MFHAREIFFFYFIFSDFFLCLFAETFWLKFRTLTIKIIEEKKKKKSNGARSTGHINEPAVSYPKHNQENLLQLTLPCFLGNKHISIHPSHL